MPGEIAIVEEHDLPSSPILLPAATHGVVFLVHAPRTSSLTKALPPGPTYYALVQERMGVLASTSAESNAETAGLVVRWAVLASGASDDTTARAAATRALAFDEVAATHPVVVEDGIQAIAALPDLAATLEDAEQRRVAAALARRDLPPRVRIALVQAIADERLTTLLPALAALRDAPPDVLAASWDARRRLGSPPSLSELDPFVKSDDPAVRAVAAPALLAAGGEKAVPAVERMALEDRDANVRKAATQALGSVKMPGGLAALARIYKASTEERQPAGVAILAWGGDEAADTLAALAFDAPPDAQKWAVTLIFALGRRDDDPRLVRIRTMHPDPSVRDLVEHGFDLGTEHH